MRVLYANQIADVSGAERSLLELLGGLPADVEPLVACPPGPLAESARALGVPAHALPATEVSFRLHPVHTTAGAVWLGRAALRLRALARREGADLIHANSARAALAAGLASRTGAPATVAHLRDIVPESRLGRGVLRSIQLGSAAVVANSGAVAAQVPRGRRAPPVEVIHNPVNLRGFDPERIDRGTARAKLGLGEEDEVLAVVGHLTPSKAQDDAIRVLAALKPARPRLKLLIVGSAKFDAPSARFDSRAYERGLRAMAMDLGVAGEIRFLGERDDVPEVLRATDVLLVPSWYEGFGRIAVEGMAMRVPVIATSVGGPSDVVRDGVDGVVLAPRDPDAWAKATSRLLSNPELRSEMGERGRDRALTEFTVERHVGRVVSVYEQVLDRLRPET